MHKNVCPKNLGTLGVGRAQARLGSARLVTKEGSSSSSARLEGGSARSGSARNWLEECWLEARLGSRVVSSKSSTSQVEPGLTRLDQA